MTTHQFTTAELVAKLRSYPYRDYNRSYFVYRLSDTKLAEILGDATTWNQAWMRVLAAHREASGEIPTPRDAGSRILKMTTKEYQSRLAPRPDVTGKLKCWELVIEAFGVTGKRTGKGEFEPKINAHLVKAGYFLEKVPELAPKGVSPTLAVFMAAHTSGDWVVYTRDHVVAIRDGVIYDRDRYSTVKKIVTSAYRVRDGKLTKYETCECSNDLTVFGHTSRCQL